MAALRGWDGRTGRSARTFINDIPGPQHYNCFAVYPETGHSKGVKSINSRHWILQSAPFSLMTRVHVHTHIFRTNPYSETSEFMAEHKTFASFTPSCSSESAYKVGIDDATKKLVFKSKDFFQMSNESNQLFSSTRSHILLKTSSAIMLSQSERY